MKHMIFGLILALALIVSLAAQAADLEGAFVVIDDEASIKDALEKLTNGQGKKALEKKDVYKEDDDEVEIDFAIVVALGLGMDTKVDVAILRYVKNNWKELLEEAKGM